MSSAAPEPPPGRDWAETEPVATPVTAEVSGPNTTVEVTMKAKARRYRLTPASVPWMVAIVLLIPYEIAMILLGREGGPLSHVMWWAYGDRGTLRWWVLTWGFVGWSAWCCWHFALRWPGLPHLIALVLAGILAGLLGWAISNWLL